MENKIPTTLLSSLKKVYEQPREYLADVCCTFNDNNEVWIHKGIILSRCPLIFRQYYLSIIKEEEEEEMNKKHVVIHLNDIISYSLFNLLLKYWYTTEWPTLLSLKLQKEIKQIETTINCKLVPPVNHDERINQFLVDMKNMHMNQLGTDVYIQLESSPTNIIFPAHRFLLASRSTYFYAMFCTEFLESKNNEIHLTDEFFSPMIIQVILHYLYLDSIFVPSPFLLLSSLTKQQKFTLKKHRLRILQLTYEAVDYIGEMNTLGKIIFNEMVKLCDDFKCLCNDCSLLLPSMLSFIDKRKKEDNLIFHYTTLIQLYSDPVNAIEHLWSQKPFAILTSSMLPSAASMMKTLDLSSIQHLDDDHRPTSTLIHEISALTYRNITKYNAIRVLHSLHLCFSKLRSADLIPTWSLPTLDLLNPILQSTVNMVSEHFDFYCVEYPILVSCVDGIGCGFSVDFLEFLLNHVLDHGIRDMNAGIIYQGIVRDLIGRQETVKNIALDDVLLNARMKCAEYLNRRWLSVKSLGGFRSLEKPIVRQLSDDIGIPYRILTKPIDYDLFSLFSFKPKSAKYNFKSKPLDNSDTPSVHSNNHHNGFFRNHHLTTRGRRGSHGIIQSSTSTNTKKSQGPSSSTTTTRPRSHSAGPSSTVYQSHFMSNKTYPSNGYINYNSLSALSTQPLLHLLSMEQQSLNTKISSIPFNQSSSSIYQHDNTSIKSLLDALLPMDELNQLYKNDSNNSNGINERSTALKFELPTNNHNSMITRAKSPVHKSLSVEKLSISQSYDLTTKKKKKNGLHKMKYSSSPSKKSKWSFSSDMSDDEDIIMITPVLGAKVMLNRRPLPTFGTIQYVGPVSSYAKGDWIGLELESRLGKNNGTVEGITYFTTDAQRGIFVRPDDFTIVSIPSIA